MEAMLLNYPGAVFYPCYEAMLCLLVRDRYQAPLSQLWWTFWLCDGVSNIVNFSLDNGGLPNVDVLAWLMVIGLARALLAPFDALALDEPFTGLDQENRARALAAIRETAGVRPVLLGTPDAADAEGAPVVRL